MLSEQLLICPPECREPWDSYQPRVHRHELPQHPEQQHSGVLVHASLRLVLIERGLMFHRCRAGADEQQNMESMN